nr:DUF305 domain-containing protein [uncultured Caldimonas sp.]
MKLPSICHAFALCAVLGSTTLPLAQPASAPADAARHDVHGAAAAASGGGSEQMHRQMMSGMQSMQSMKPSGDVDKDFAKMMRVHHQQAVDMAEVELKHGRSPELKAMARKIIEDQRKEIAQLDKWLQERK